MAQAMGSQMRAEERYTPSPGAYPLLNICTKSSINASVATGTDSTVSGVDANASKGFVGHSEDQMKRTMHHVVETARRIEGLHIKRYSFNQDELEVIAAVDEGLAHDDLEKRLQSEDGKVRVKLTCGHCPQFKLMSGQLGPGGIVTAVNEKARIIGYVSNNTTDVYALTVGHVFTSTKSYTEKCQIMTTDEITCSGTARLSVVKMEHLPEKRDGPIHDLALIRIDNPVSADNTWIIDGQRRYAKIHREIAVLIGKRVCLLPTTLDNINIARVTSMEYTPDEKFIRYTLERECGGPVAIPGDSGTLVCSMPQPNEDKMLAYAYMFASTKQNSWALHIEEQLKDLLAGSPLDYAGFDFVKKVETIVNVSY